MQNQQIVIDVSHLKKTFGKTQAVNDISLVINEGEIFGFLGANGSGKTTTLRMLCGLLLPDNGKGHCLGFDLVKESYEIKKRLGYMTQHFSLYQELTVKENLSFVARMYQVKHKKSKILSILKKFNLLGIENQLSGTLSGGQKQRLALASCMLHEPKLLLLDEPTAGVDPKARGDFWDSIHQLSEHGVTTLLSTHYMDEAQRCTRLAYLSCGNILIQGSMSKIIEKVNLKTYEVKGERLMELANSLRQDEGIEQVILYGSALHVSGISSSSFDRAVKEHQSQTSAVWTEIESSLEDAFIYLTKKESIL